MTVGLRQDKLGSDVSIPRKERHRSKSIAAFTVLLREKEPDTFFEAPRHHRRISVTDVEVHLDPRMWR
jgi:hypothetical protein